MMMIITKHEIYYTIISLTNDNTHKLILNII